jgi:hypothetical protein
MNKLSFVKMIEPSKHNDDIRKQQHVMIVIIFYNENHEIILVYEAIVVEIFQNEQKAMQLNLTDELGIITKQAEYVHIQMQIDTIQKMVEIPSY